MVADGSVEMPGHTGLIDNLPVLREAAAGAGVAALVQDADGTVRRVAAIVQADGRLLAGLGPEAVRVAESRSGFLIETDGMGPEALRIGERRVPVLDASWGWFRPRLCGLDRLPVVRAADLLERAAVPTVRGAGSSSSRRFGAGIDTLRLLRSLGGLSGFRRDPGGQRDRRSAPGAVAPAAGIRRFAGNPDGAAR